MLFVIVDCSTSFSPSTSASPILKFVGLGPSAQGAQEPSGVAGNGAHFKGGYAAMRWLQVEEEAVVDCSPRYHAVPQSSEGRWPGRCCAPCVAQHLDTSHVVSSL